MKYTAKYTNLLKIELLKSTLFLLILGITFFYMLNEGMLLILLIFLSYISLIIKSVFFLFWGINVIEIKEESLEVSFSKSHPVILDKNDIEYIARTDYGFKIKADSKLSIFQKQPR